MAVKWVQLSAADLDEWRLLAFESFARLRMSSYTRLRIEEEQT